MLLKTSIFSSNATFSILIALAEISTPVSFRELIRRSNIGIRSAQLAVEKLLKEKLLSVSRFKNQKLYKLTSNSALDEIRLIAEHRKNRRLAENAKRYSKNLNNIIKSTDELLSLSMKLRRLNPISENE